MDIAVLNKFNANGVSILNFKKRAFADRVFTLTHFQPMLDFIPPENIRKPEVFLCFQGI